MKYPRRMLDRVISGAELESEPLPRQPLVEICSNQRVLIENHKGVIGYTQEEICVKVHFGCVCICGAGLILMQMTKEQLVVKGCIHSVQLRGGK